MKFTKIELELYNSGSIEKLYELLDILYLRGDNRVNEIIDVKNLIFDEAISYTSDAFIEGKKISLNKSDEAVVLRAIYEKGISLYESESYDEASQLFSLLSNICGDSKRFSYSMDIHNIVSKDMVPLEKFIAIYVESKNSDDFYITEFSDKAKKLHKERCL